MYTYLNKQVIKMKTLTTSYVLEAIEDGYKRLISHRLNVK